MSADTHGGVVVARGSCWSAYTRLQYEQGIVFTDNGIYLSHKISEVLIHLSSACCLPVYKGICYGDGL